MGEKIRSFFFDPRIEQIARETKFVQRRSPLTGLLFLKTLVMGYLEKSKGSLSHLAQVCGDLELSISAQGIDERISGYSVAFLASVLGHAMEWFQQQCPLVLPILQHFRAIQIVDSTFMQLPAAMQDQYPGAGGSGSPASLKIQLVFDFLSGQFQQVSLQAGRNADQAYRDYLQVVQAGALILVDLGYFCLDAFVLGGRPQHRLPCRLIAVRAPAGAVEERRRKAIRKASQHHKVLTAEYLDLLAWSLFVTNVPVQFLSCTQVVLLYRLRWQIEFLFKLWKSYAGLNAIGPWRSERLLTELYAKMIGCVLFQFLLVPLRIPDDEWAGRELSPVQAHHILSRFALRLALTRNDPLAFDRILQLLLDSFALKQKRSRHPNVCQRLASALA